MANGLKNAVMVLVGLLLGFVIFNPKNQGTNHNTPQHNSTSISDDRIDAIVTRAMETFNVPGMAVAVMSPDRPTPYFKGYGIANVDTQTPVSPDTIFGIASHSKAYTTGALAILVDEGIIKWDDRVQKYIPEFELYDPWVSEHFTIRDLLTHRSGLPLGAGDLMWWPNPDFSRQDVINGLKHLKPTSQFRTKYDYDNLLYIVAGEIVTRTSGMAWEDFVTERIFKPLDMTNCYAVRRHIPAGTDEARPHAVVDGQLVTTFFTKSEPSSAAASLTCSLKDHAKWVQMQLNDGVLPNGEALFSKRQHAEMWKPITLRGVSNSMRDRINMQLNAYGLGWGISNYHEQLMVQHSGGLQGMVTLTTLLPDTDTAVIVFTNRMLGGPMRAITYQILEEMFGYQSPDSDNQDWISFYDVAAKASAERAAATIKNASPQTAETKPASTDLAAVIGTYNDPWYGDIHVRSSDDGKARIIFSKTPVLVGDLSHHDGDTYIATWDDRSLFADAYLTVKVKDGAVVSATMKAVSPETDFSYDFHHLSLSKVE